MPVTKRKSPRQRSFGGCVTCRSRHVKCDEGRDCCKTCRDAGLKCGGYQKAIFFDSFPSSSDNTIRFRRPLFSESERSCMSDALVKSVPAHLALWHIEQIDQKSEKASQADRFQTHHGPFGAFRIADNHSPDTTSALREGTNALPSKSGDIGVDATELSVEPCMPTMLNSSLDDRILDIDLIGSSSFLGFSPGVSNFEDMFDVESFLTNDIFPTDMLLDSQEIQAPSPPSQEIQLSNSPSEPLGLILFEGALQASLPHDAVYLVKHYSTTVLRALTPFRHTKTPWHILFLPHAKNCLAALTLGETLDHASLCAFYGMLAVSAYSLGAVSASSKWLDGAKGYKLQARYHAKYMLKTAYDIPKTSKYKTILVALLTMVQAAMVSGDPEQTDCYFVEAEKFIRLRGLNRKKSRKVRLLHHCYAFERMFHESTFVAGLNTAHRQHVRKAIESSGAIVHSHDSLTFRLGDWGDLDDAMARTKNTEEGENDLHLELPGIWSATLYPEIFGVPEVYVFLLSLTIRLGEQKDANHLDIEPSSATVGDFMTRARALERSINSLQHYSPNQANLDQTDSDVKVMLTAMQNALSIYFYRRIYDIDASLLQSKVDTIKNSLMALRPSTAESTYGLARLLWPALIAGCESEDLTTRAAILDWLETASKASGSQLFSDTKAKIERVWAKKLETDAECASWLELMKINSHAVAVF